jgi:hypothetical protein
VYGDRHVGADNSHGEDDDEASSEWEQPVQGVSPATAVKNCTNANVSSKHESGMQQVLFEEEHRGQPDPTGCYLESEPRDSFTPFRQLDSCSGRGFAPNTARVRTDGQSEVDNSVAAADGALEEDLRRHCLSPASTYNLVHAIDLGDENVSITGVSLELFTIQLYKNSVLVNCDFAFVVVPSPAGRPRISASTNQQA